LESQQSSHPTQQPAPLSSRASDGYLDSLLDYMNRNVSAEKQQFEKEQKKREEGKQQEELRREQEREEKRKAEQNKDEEEKKQAERLRQQQKEQEDKKKVELEKQRKRDEEEDKRKQMEDTVKKLAKLPTVTTSAPESDFSPEEAKEGEEARLLKAIKSRGKQKRTSEIFAAPVPQPTAAPAPKIAEEKPKQAWKEKRDQREVERKIKAVEAEEKKKKRTRRKTH